MNCMMRCLEHTGTRSGCVKKIFFAIHVNRDDAKRNQGKVEQVKIRMGIQIDDGHFRTLLQDTQVGLDFMIIGPGCW